VLGINTNRLGEGFYLAIPADDALRTGADALARGESAASPRLGVAIAPASVARRLRRAVGLPDTDGLLIRGVIEDSAAARAGVAQGDLSVAAAGQPIGTGRPVRCAPGRTGRHDRAEHRPRHRRTGYSGHLRRYRPAGPGGIKPTHS
jgi:hypothetical protein